MHLRMSRKSSTFVVAFESNKILLYEYDYQ